MIMFKEKNLHPEPFPNFEEPVLNLIFTVFFFSVDTLPRCQTKHPKRSQIYKDASITRPETPEFIRMTQAVGWRARRILVSTCQRQKCQQFIIYELTE